MKVPSTKPHFGEDHIESISKEIGPILRGGRLILGPKTREFERLFASYCGVKYAVAVNSCTSALEVCLRHLDVTDREVIVPTNTFVATSNAVIYAGGTPVLADMKAETLCLDPADFKQRITPKTKGVIVVHIAGLPCPDIDEIREICIRNNLFLLEDAAHAHGAELGHRKTGSIGDAGCFSFYPTKVMTTGTGGMITTDDDQLAAYAVSLRHHGVGAGLTDIVNPGNDWLMNEIGALIGIHQLAMLEENITNRNKVAETYTRAFSKLELVECFPVPVDARHSYYKYPVLLSKLIDKAEAVHRMAEYEIEIGSVYDPPCHLQPLYQRLFGYRHGMFKNADDILGHVCCLPVYPQMTTDEIDYVIEKFVTVLLQCRQKITA